MWSLFLFVLPLATGALTVLLLWLAEGTRFQIRGVVGPFFVSVSFVFGLLASLVTSDVWASINRATLLVDQEAGALRSVLRIAESDPFGEAIRFIRPRLEEFVAIELKNRDARLESAGAPAQRLENLSRDIYAYIANPKSFGGDPVMRGNLLTRFEAMRDARFQRLAITSDHISDAKLALVLMTGFLTQIAIAMVHAGSMRPKIASLVLFSLTCSVFLVSVDYFQTHQTGFDLVSWRALEAALR